MSDDFGARVREARERLGYSIKALSDITGLDRKTIAAIEAGETVPKARTSFMLRAALGFGDVPANAEAVIFNVLGDYNSDLDWIDEVGGKLVTALREAGLLR